MTARELILSFAGPWATHCQSPKTVALSFDDGPHPETTAKLLDMLDDAQVKATMFVNGKSCRGMAGLLREVEERGHVLANHGYVHRSHAFRNSTFLQNSILQTHFTLEDFGLHPARLFRPPFGAFDWRTSKRTRDIDFVPVLWSAHVADWKQQENKQLRARLNAVLEERMILLLHDGKETIKTVIEELPAFCDEARRRGWSFVTLDPELTVKGAVA